MFISSLYLPILEITHEQYIPPYFIRFVAPMQLCTAFYPQGNEFY